MKSNCDDPFWVNDPFLLIRPDRIIEFYPSLDMCANERVNAVSRFILYTGLCTAFVQKNIKPIAISLAMIATLAFLYHPKSDKKMLDEYFHNKKMNCTLSTDDNIFMNLLPLDPEYNKKVNQKPCDELKLPNNRKYTVPPLTGDFAHNLHSKNMGECKGGDQSACGVV